MAMNVFLLRFPSCWRDDRLSTIVDANQSRVLQSLEGERERKKEKERERRRKREKERERQRERERKRKKKRVKRKTDQPFL